MKKNRLKAAVCALVGLCALFTFAGCGGDVWKEGDPESKVCEVKAVIQGYGDTWVKEMAKEFNAVYADEGYEVKVTETGYGDAINAVNDMINPKKCTTDIFFGFSLIQELMDRSRSVMKKDGVSILEDLSDFYNSPAIGMDKKESGGSILSRMSPEIKDGISYNGRQQGFDGLYGVPWQGGTTGWLANPAALAKFGYTLNDIVTTDKFVAVCDAIAPANPLDKDAVFPIAFGKETGGYWEYVFHTLYSQYEGAAKYKDFWDCVPESGTTAENGYTVFENRGIYEALKVIQQFANLDYAVSGSLQMEYTAAQARVLLGKSVFMSAGDWVYKEMEAHYPDEIANAVTIKTPVISALGVKLNLSGEASHAEDQPCPECDNILAGIVSDVDADILSDAAIAAKYGAGVTADKVAVIRASRGYFYSFYSGTLGVIPSYSNAKTVAKLFLKFLYSDDGMAIYRNETHVDLPIAYVNKPDTSGDPAYLKSISEKVNSSNSQLVSSDAFKSPLRTLVGLGVFPKEGADAYVYGSLAYSHSRGQASVTAKSVFESNAAYVKANWGHYLNSAGMGK
ncbi:MAG: ABC transporter substrate-binding protein [Clostridiales bacterium]|jgi:ABC-type glycerol-3-phosphate transport system substrate-binding protein|nr:ABC transporter substrate-binding protein [Clostridiales bacterium]